MRHCILVKLWLLSPCWFFRYFLLWLDILCFHFFRFARSLWIFITFLFYLKLSLLSFSILSYFRLWFSLKLLLLFIFISAHTTFWHFLWLYFSNEINLLDNCVMANNRATIIIHPQYIAIIQSLIVIKDHFTRNMASSLFLKRQTKMVP